MTALAWLAFVAASIVLLFSPGPTVLLVVSYALSQGRRVAFRVAAGVALGDFVAMTLSLAGLGGVLSASSTLFTILKLIGAAYLVYLGIRLWRSTPTLPDLSQQKTDDRGIFSHAFAVTALNPKSIVFFLAFVPQFVDHQSALLPQFAILEATFIALAATNAVLYALAADQLRLRIRRPGVLRWINRLGASFLVGMGVATATLNRT